MRNTKKILFSGALIGALAFTSVTHAEGEPQMAADQTVPQAPAQQDATPAVPQIPAQQDPLVPTQSAPDQVNPGEPQSATPPEAAQQLPTDPYDVTEFFSDAQRYAIGDAVPEKYRTKTYEIIEWQKRHLPAPEADSHWTYMGGNYVLIANSDGKIIKVKSGDIFFH